jgi:hypothetical protein
LSSKAEVIIKDLLALLRSKLFNIDYDMCLVHEWERPNFEVLPRGCIDIVA